MEHQTHSPKHDPHSSQFRDLTGHLLRVFSSAQIIPELSAAEIDRYAALAEYHDLGKRAIPRAILDKPGLLTAEEFAIMKTHTTEVSRLLRDDPAFSQRADLPLLHDVCRHHHERWDGGGYPDRLSGRQITPWVHAVGMADAFDALIHPRAYKPAFSRRQAAEMISSGACGIFDPDMVECFRQNIPGIYFQVYCGMSA